MTKHLRTGLVLAALVTLPVLIYTTAAQAGVFFGEDPTSPKANTKMYYRDRDSDGYGDPLTKQRALTQQKGWVLNDDDCNDYNPLIGNESCE